MKRKKWIVAAVTIFFFSIVVEELSPSFCQTNAECDASGFCVKKMGDCDGKGECRSRDQGLHPLPLNIVCGCDGKTYDSPFTAYGREGVNIAHGGHCANPQSRDLLR